MSKLIYIIGPYRGKTIRETVENIRQAEAAAVHFWKQGWAVLCPHMNSALLDGVVTDEAFLEGAMEMLRRCDSVAVLSDSDGLASSAGSQAEIQEAKRLGKDMYSIHMVSWPMTACVQTLDYKR